MTHSSSLSSFEGRLADTEFLARAFQETSEARSSVAPSAMPELDALRRHLHARRVLVLKGRRASSPRLMGCSSDARKAPSSESDSGEFILIPKGNCTIAVETDDLSRTRRLLDARDRTVKQLVARALGRVILREENSVVYELAEGNSMCLAYSSPRMMDVLRQAESIADSDRPVLILGETGVGKELVTRYIHEMSGREKFVAISMAQMRGDSAVSELFGHLKGAFTGAATRRLGAFLEAGEGTLFLDEISEMPEPVMALLLRAIETRRVKPLGSDQECAAPARIVAATNRPERLRKELFYRFVHRIEIPALRDRKSDIRAIARLIAFRESFDLTEKALVALETISSWDGNARELEYFLFQAASMAKNGVLGAKHVMRAFATSVQFENGANGTSSPVRGLRKALGLSIRELASVLEIPKSTLEDIEKRRNEAREREVLSKIEESLSQFQARGSSSEGGAVSRQLRRFIEEE
ncbi:MAG TPA: sigma 54-interacting transcriptional regulator [Vicinamibacteria bacterium]|nr:sigma 54-interacting transcriptional regulator [Vicinamibacteria bacterium]